MSIILNIDTAVASASLCLAKDGIPLKFDINNNQKDHAAWLHPTIHKLINESGLTLKDIEAVAVTIGPGSYTGLRVGLSTAKGLCYALGVPLIAVNTLEMMAQAVKIEQADLICPLIDARRMEVFTAVYDKNMKEIIGPSALIIGAESFQELLASGKIIFLGNGINKLQKLIVHPNAIFSNIVANATHLAILSSRSYLEKKFADLAYAEPFYIKEFHSNLR